MSINRVIISGNLTRDPELKATASGMSVLKLGVAVNDRRKNQQTGEWEEFPNFVDVTVFGQRGESLSRFLEKGSRIGVDGKLRWSEWENQQGEKRSKLEVVADDIEFMSPRGSGGGGGYSGPTEMPATDAIAEEDIPF
jgi:single-strand DNA-binding protein